mgnify:FL=1|tara:strand:- start:215 stop:673 length:459 start_codon:yes stop_codon:yes gene_type:complete
MFKRFDRELFEKFDKLARDAGKRYWKAKGYHVIDNTDRYGPDLIVTPVGGDEYSNGDFYCEVEIKRPWKGKDFQYPQIQIPGRKAKFLNKDKYNLPICFLVLNADQTYGYLIEGETLAETPLVEVPNKYVWKGEKFFRIPAETIEPVEIPSE